MRTNLIISTYAGKYGIMDKKNYLKIILALLNKINTNITQITIMKPRINEIHIEYEGFYNFDTNDISKIKDKIKIIDCENIGISYGQFFTGIKHNLDFDYHFFLEDDIIFFSDYFEETLINEMKHDSYLCAFFFKDKKWNIFNECNRVENQYIFKNFIDVCASNGITDFNSEFHEPSMSTGVISKSSVQKILNRFTFEQINNIFNVNFGCMYLFQLLFGYILFSSGIGLNDISEKNVNLFYHTGGEVTMCNFGTNLHKWNEQLNIKLNIPVFCPIEFFYPYNHTENINVLKNFLIDYEKFIDQYNMLNYEVKILTDKMI